MFTNPADGVKYLIQCESARAANGDAYCETHERWHVFSCDFGCQPMDHGLAL